MSDTKHSGLPWHADDDGIIRSSDGIPVAQVFDNPDTGNDSILDEPSHHNEQLILRSVNTHPGLLEALEEAKKFIDPAGESGFGTYEMEYPRFYERADELRKKIESALASARS